MWLNERNLDIRCVRIIPYKFQNQVVFDVQQIIPLPEAESYQVKIRKQSEERREAKQSSKDYTRYVFAGSSFNKRKLVLAVIRQWVNDNKPKNIADMLQAFPQEIKSGGLFVTEQEAREIYNKQGIYRHFLDFGEILELPDSTRYAVSNQWGKDNIDKFVNQAKKLGYEIEETN